MKKNIILTISAVTICSAITFGAINMVNSHAQNECSGIQIECNYPSYNLEDLTNKADLIVQGVVVDTKEAKWNNDKNKKPKKPVGKDIIYKDNVIKIINVLKNTNTTDTKSEIVVRSYEGEADGFTMSDKSQPNFKNGEEGVLFLIKDKNNTPYNKTKEMELSDAYIILGGTSQGNFKLQNGAFFNNDETFTEIDFKANIQKYILNPKVYEEVPSTEKNKDIFK